LIVAAENGHKACVRVLIAAKADLAYADRYGWTALHHAANNGHASICRVLVDEGASLMAMNHQNQLPLELAQVRRNAGCVLALEAPTLAAKAALAVVAAAANAAAAAAKAAAAAAIVQVREGDINRVKLLMC